MASRIHNVKRNTAWGLVNKIVQIIFPFIIRTEMIYVLGIEYLGLSSLFTSILKILNLAELGFSSAIVYSMYKPIADNDTERICTLLNLYKKVYRIIGLIVLAVGLILLPFLNSLIKGDYPADINIQVLYLIYLFNSVLSYYLFAYRTSLLSAYQRNDVIYIISCVASTLLYTAEFLLIQLFKSYYLYALCAPLFTVVNNLIVYICSRKLFPNICCRGKVEKHVFVDIRTRLVALIGHRLGVAVITAADSIVISGFLGLTAVAIYNNYYYILAAVVSIIDMCTGALVASVGNSLVTESSEKNYRIFNLLVFGFTWFIGWCAISYVCLIQNFIIIWVGEALMYNSTYTVILLGVYLYVWKIRGIGLRFKEAAGMWTEDFWKPYVSSVVNIVLNIILINYIGVDGVLISTILVMILINQPWEISVLHRSLFHKKQSKFYINSLKMFLITITSGIITYLLCDLFSAYGIQALFAKAFICIFIPNIIFLMFLHKDENFKALLRISIKKNRNP